MAVQTLLLCFIHGFKGDEETFWQFPEDLKNTLSTSQPDFKIETRVYPKYETRGDLALSVQTFKEWLQDQVINLESSSGNTSSAIHSPSVSVILCAHSMGGFVAADTLFSVLDNRPVSPDSSVKLMWPLIQGVLVFDTPWNGLSRSMFAYGAFSQYQNISSAWNLLSTGGGLLTSAGARTALSSTASSTAQNQLAARGATSNNSWTRWSALAARTGTYGAIMAGGVAAYIHRDQILSSLRGINRENISKINYTNTKEAITSINYSDSISQGLTYVSRESIGEGFAWMASHLKFVGALMKTSQLTARLERLSEIEGVGVKCLYTSLGENGVWSGGYFVPKRTFCAVPVVPNGKDEQEKLKSEKMKELFVECPDVKAGNEIVAHCGMFRKERNENYDNMFKLSTKLVGEWLKEDPRGVKDEWRISGEQLKRTMSESKVWDDDGKVLKPPGGEGDEGQLDAILRSDEMPQGEDGGVDENELMEKAMGIPLPVDEDVIGEGVLGEQAFGDEIVAEVAPQEVSKEDDKLPMTEPTEDLEIKDDQIAEAPNTATSNDKSQVPDKPLANTSTPEAKRESTNAKTTKSWTSMVPSIPSFGSKTGDSNLLSKSTESKDEQTGSSQRSWGSMLPSIPSFTAKKSDQTTKEKTENGQATGAATSAVGESSDQKASPKAEKAKSSPKTWSSMLPSVPSLPGRSKETSQKEGSELLVEEEDTTRDEQAIGQARTKGLGVV